ncbi:MAG TPA: polysaccharide biosynthesis/export family protein, partial [Candidatus Omnitrophota bacterium]|nr:polysaccharide biosynthesis/export family protein [Candidatus Omnitrophota bacterium]
MKRIIISVCILIALFSFSANALAKKDAKKKDVEEKNKTYSVGVDDVLDIVILQPEELTMSVAVAPDGSINLPYVGNVYVEGLNLEK